MKQKFFPKLIFTAGFFLFFLVRPVFAQLPSGTTDLVPCTGFECNWCSVFQLLQTVFNTAQIIIFPLIVIYIIYGAVLYIISATTGSEEGLTKARATATDAIIGLIIVMLTFVIVNATIVGILGANVSLENFVRVDCTKIDTTPTTTTQ